MPHKVTTLEEFIERARAKHGDRYDYSCVSFNRLSDKVKIICKDHGVFEQRATHHIKGNGCPTCHFKNKRKTIEDFIEESKSLYGDKYDYCDVEYKNNKTEVVLTCKTHNHTFSQSPKKHLLGEGCKYCLSFGEHKDGLSYFVFEASKVHGNKYDYSQVEYTKKLKDVRIVCLTHGEFLQKPNIHFNGSGCPKCARLRRRDSTLSFIKKANKVHGNSYNYSKVNYVTSNKKVTIICPKHGEFQQLPNSHIAGGGCINCAGVGKQSRGGFIDKSSILHKGKYDYSLVVYINCKEKVTIVCQEHGEFKVTPDCHINGLSGCPRCANHISKAEIAIKDYIDTLGFTTISSDRSLIKPLELDIVIPDKKIAIEYNGLRWHTEKFGKDKNYHLGKTKSCNAAGYRLIHIWEDDYLSNPERELAFLKHTLGCTDNERIYARKTKLREIDKKEARDFLDQYHIQGSVGASSFIGAFYGDKLVSVTAFTYKNNKSYVELVRHVNGDVNVVGSLGKATKYFSELCGLDIISFCDLSRFDGKSYEKAGFEVDKVIAPDYKYVLDEVREHKFGWRKDSIKIKLPDIYDEALTEKEMMEIADIPRLWDCGKTRYIFKNKGMSDDNKIL